VDHNFLLTSSPHLNFSQPVRDADGQEVFFKVKRSTKLSKLKKAYAERMGKPGKLFFESSTSLSFLAMLG